MLSILKGIQGRVKNVMAYLIHSALALLGVVPRASGVLGRCSTAELSAAPNPRSISFPSNSINRNLVSRTKDVYKTLASWVVEHRYNPSYLGS